MTPIKLNRIATQDPNSTPLERLKTLIESTWPENDAVAGIGVAAPGPTDPYNGILMAAPNIPGWVNLPLRQYLEEYFHVPIALGNDANLAALGEWRFGAGRGHHYMMYLTISTGIGGGVIINDQLLLGQRGLAGELGHITVMQEGPICGCGQRGHLEAVASGTAIARWVREEVSRGVPSSLPSNQPLTGKMISQAAQEGDALAIEALTRAGTFIGQALANYLHIFNPSAIVIGGGVSQSGPFLLDPMYTSLKRHLMSPSYLDNLTLTTATLGDEVGLMGALALAWTLG